MYANQDIFTVPLSALPLTFCNTSFVSAGCSFMINSKMIGNYFVSDFLLLLFFNVRSRALFRNQW